MARSFYALGLHMHQPPDNLALLLDSNSWEAKQIIRCYERVARYAHQYPDVARLHVGFSGILLRQFLDPQIIDRYRPLVDIPQMLEMYRSAKNIEIIGMGFYHPIFPLIPPEDWADQLKEGREIVEKVFHQSPQGFWPSEMAFSMDMIPALKKAGYRYVVVDHVHVKPLRPPERPDFFKPYLADHDKHSIVVIPRHRDLSNAQESGMNPGWLVREIRQKMGESPSPKVSRLVTTWSDGENGGWFRQMDENAGFFGYFFTPLINMIRKKETDVAMTKLSEYIRLNPPMDKAVVQTGAWNVASRSGYDFSQWNGSPTQKKALEALFATSQKYWGLVKREGPLNPERQARLAQARQLILDAETSCYLFWGEMWLGRIYGKLNEATRLMSDL